jgi:hypothetical protein
MAHTWIDLSAARSRLAQIDRELVDIEKERSLIEAVLGNGEERPRRGRPPGRPPKHAVPQPGPRRRGRPSKSEGPGASTPFIKLVLEALRRGPASGSTVAEIIGRIGSQHPDRVKASNISAFVSSAIGHARKTENPRIKVLKQGGPGVPSRYGLT